MKEFLEKRWWGGVGVIIGIIALAIIIWQLWDVVGISWLAVTIALNIILAIALLLVAIWNTKLKRKYEHANIRMEKISKILNQLEKQEETTKPRMVLLPDPNYIWKLNIDNALLTQLYGQAHGLVTNKFRDAKLHSLSIIVNPYDEYDRVSILFGFYSRRADRQCTYIVNETGGMRESLPNRPATDEMDRVILDEMPWLRDTNWPEFLRKSCEIVGPLSPDWRTKYHLSMQSQFPPLLELPPWSISFEDGVTGKEFGFSWDGKGEPIPEEAIQKALRKKLKSWLKIKRDK